MKHSVIKEQLSKLEADKNQVSANMQKEKEFLLAQLAEKEEILQLELKKKENIVTSSKSESARKTEVINALNATIDEEKQKNTDLERKIIDLKQENVNLT